MSQYLCLQSVSLMTCYVSLKTRYALQQLVVDSGESGRAFHFRNLNNIIIMCHVRVQFMQEISVAWQTTVDMRLGLFSSSEGIGFSATGCRDDADTPQKINISPHNLWTHVSLC